MDHKLEPANIIFDLHGVIFQNSDNDPEIKILQPGLEILKKCATQKDKHGNKLHKIYVLSNWGRPGFDKLNKEFPEIMDLFDGYVISGDHEFKKPDKQLYHIIIDKYGLDNQRCIFLDDSHINATTADQIGWIGIHYDNPNIVTQTLKFLKVIL